MTTDELLQASNASPDDDGLREQAARALERDGRQSDLLTVLAGFTNMTAHDGAVLPCLCRRCLATTAPTAQAGGLTFVRGFAIAKGRVLHYWVPEDLAPQRKGVDASVAAVMNGRLRPRKKRAAQP